MNRFSLSTILYLPLGYIFLDGLTKHYFSGYNIPIPVPMTLYVVMLLSFVALVVLDIKRTAAQPHYWPRFAVIVGTIVVFLSTAVFSQIMARHISGNDHIIHDGALLTEVAGDALLHGKNPYQENYQFTPFGEIHDYHDVPGRDNPAWHYYIYLPFYLISSTVAQWISISTIGWFDHRFLLIIAFMATLALLYRATARREDKLSMLLLFSLNPLTLPFFVTGYNDIFVFFWIVLAAWLLIRGKMGWSALAVGLAVASKQSAWFLVPIYLLAVYYLLPQTLSLKERLLKLLRTTWPLYVAVALFFLPFFVWSPADFINDTVKYAAGSAEHNYPISGWGLAGNLIQAGVIKDVYDTYPFWIFEAVIGLPLLVAIGYWIRKRRRPDLLLAMYLLWLLVLWLLSRFFNPNYLGFISMLAIASWGLTVPPETARDDTA